MTLRYLIQLSWAFLSRFKFIIIASVILGIFSFFIVRFLSPLIFETGYRRIGVVGRFKPDTIPRSILALSGNGLTKLNDEGVAGPDLASSWETPDKGKSWIFRLKDDVVWQDGKKLISSDLTYKFTDAQVTYPDSKTIHFNLQNAFSPFPAIVSSPVFRKGLLGTGEWKVTKATFVGDFVDQVSLINSSNHKQIFKFYPTEERAKLAFKLGEVDILSEIFSKEPFDNWQTANIHPHENPNRVVVIFFNTKDDRLSEKALRQALAYAIKKGDFEGKRALGPISSSSWAYNPQVKPYDYDIKRAKSLIDELPQKIRENLTITLTTSQILLPEADKVANFWKEVGVKTEVKGFSGIPTEFQAFMAIFDIPSDPDQYSFWHSSQVATNISKLGSPKIDKLLEDGRTELSFDSRRKIYLDFQRFLVEESPAVFLYHPITFSIERK